MVFVRNYVKRVSLESPLNRLIIVLTSNGNYSYSAQCIDTIASWGNDHRRVTCTWHRKEYLPLCRTGFSNLFVAFFLLSPKLRVYRQSSTSTKLSPWVDNWYCKTIVKINVYGSWSHLSSVHSRNVINLHYVSGGIEYLRWKRINDESKLRFSRFKISISYLININVSF